MITILIDYLFFYTFNINIERNLKYIISFFIFFLSCSKPIDYFGNDVELNQNELYLIRSVSDSLHRNIFYLTFALKTSTNPTVNLNNESLQSYLKLLMHTQGYESMSIIDYKLYGIIQPRLYMKIKYN